MEKHNRRIKRKKKRERNDYVISGGLCSTVCMVGAKRKYQTPTQLLITFPPCVGVCVCVCVCVCVTTTAKIQ